jgi:hypothetical protein
VIDQGTELVFVSRDYDFGAPAALQGQKAGLITVFLCASDPKAGVAGIGPPLFSANNAAQTEGATLADWAVKKRNLKKGSVLLDESIEYDKSVCAGYDWEYPIVGGTIVGRAVVMALILILRPAGLTRGREIGAPHGARARRRRAASPSPVSRFRTRFISIGRAKRRKAHYRNPVDPRPVSTWYIK